MVVSLNNFCKKKCKECVGSCSGFNFKITIRDKETGFNAIGDNFDKPYIKYIADSILYQIETPHDTTGSLSPELIGSGEYILKLRYSFFEKYIQDKTGWYSFIIHLNDKEIDTVKVLYKNEDIRYQVYQNDSLVGFSICDGAGKNLIFFK